MLLHTRLYPPPLRPGLIRRDMLLTRLDQGLAAGRQLTLVSAPAGYGKTSLVRAWLEELGRVYTWLALDRSDNYPAQLLAYLAAALQRIDPGIGVGLETAPKSLAAEDLIAPFEVLINDIIAFGQSCVLVLDDYQVITDVAIQSGLAFLLDHLPSNLHLVIVSRQDPLLRLSIYRSRGLMTEVRLSDLRFTQAEVGAFLNDVMQLNLPPEQLASLALRTEGWAAGLHLAGISLSERSMDDTEMVDRSRTAFIQSFTGDDRYVMDYLMDEVLSLESESVQRFLLHTSILKQMCGPLCDAVLADSGQPGESQRVLERLERSNQFIIPLDNQRHWYRYHHLFGDLLHSRLQTGHAELLPELHHRASRWYAEHGYTAEAIDHALLAEDFGHALSLIESAAHTTIWSTGDLPALLNWLRRLPEDALSNRPRLALYTARALFFSGQMDTAAAYVEGAERTLFGRDAQEPVTAELFGVLYTNQATFAAMRGEIQLAQQYVSKAAPLVLEQDLSGQGRLGHALGMTQYLSGQYNLAKETLADALHQSVLAANRNLGLDLGGLLALVHIESGRLASAQTICTQALSAFPEGPSAPAACSVYLSLAHLAFEQDDLAEAQARIEQAHDLAQKAGWVHILWRTHVLQAQIRAALRDHPGVEQVWWHCEQLLLQYNIPWVERLVDASRTRLALALGDQATANVWAEVYENEDSGEVLPIFEEMTLAQVYLAQGRSQAALHILNLLEPVLINGGGLRALVEAGVLRALALRENQRIEEARAALSQAAERAVRTANEHLVRPFLDHRAALVKLVKILDLKFHPPLLEHLLGAAQDMPELAKAASPPRPSESLIEPLSPRELEVLGLIAAGMSNPEIAAHLYLSVNTMRAHTTHIYQKLDVHNRVQAVSRARQLGLLPED
jgi:LuxR family transcriptional regulator, maltose regulon positive regulatory protein